MKIIYVENVRIPSERAHAYQIVETCAWLARLGHDVTLVNPDRAGERDVFSWYGLPKNLFTHERLKSWDPLSSWPVAKALAYALQRMAFVAALRRWCAAQQADIWYTRDAAMIDALRGVVSGPWILESHDTPDADALRWNRIKSLVSGHVAISQGMAERLKEIGVATDRIHVAPDGYDPSEFKYLPNREDLLKMLNLQYLSPKDFVALYIGSFYQWKGVELAIEAWRHTPGNFHLILIGGPHAEAKRLQKIFPTLPEEVRKRIRLFAWKSRNDLVPFYSIAHVGLMMSSPEHDIASRYTSPLKQFEYLAAGLPILASDVPSSHEVLDQTVARFFVPTPDAFVEALTSVSNDVAWRSSASAAGPELVKPYSWEARTRALADWLKTMVSA